MKHMVQLNVTQHAGVAIEARSGGPGPVIGRVIERFKPEAVYMSPARREIFMVCELSATDMAEFMIAGSELCGQYPTFTPVVDAKEFGALVAKAMPGAKKLIEG